MKARGLWVFGPLLAGVAILAPGRSLPAADAADSVCATCHEEVATAFGATAHGRSFDHDPHFVSADCQSCHGPGDAHAESGDPSLIFNPARGAAERTNETCMSCHGGAQGQAHWQGSEHERAGLDCASCHSVHAQPAARPAMLAVSHETEKCLSCHAPVRKALHQRSSHPLDEGKVECASCHNPHGTSGEHLIEADSVNALCYSCHQDKRGPFLWEHSPAREDCLTCHTPHGSNHPSLLVARTVQLCQSCHQQGRHQTVAGLPTSVWNINRQCANCHSQIHGSNHPSGPLFMR